MKLSLELGTPRGDLALSGYYQGHLPIGSNEGLLMLDTRLYVPIFQFTLAFKKYDLRSSFVIENNNRQV